MIFWYTISKDKNVETFVVTLELSNLSPFKKTKGMALGET